jgi:hypothetical protein
MKIARFSNHYYLKFKNIKKSILVLIFCSLSSVAFGEVNDVYYCEMNHLISIKKDKKESYNSQKFKFQRLESKINFGNEDNYFQKFEMNVTFSSSEVFSASNEIAMLSYREGVFHYSASTYDKVIAISANCSIFNQ